MSRLVIAHIDDDQAKAVEKILRDAVDVQPMLGPIDDLDALADAVSNGTDVEHDLHVTASMHSDGAALSIPEGSAVPIDGLAAMLRQQLGDDMEIVRLTIVAEGRAAS